MNVLENARSVPASRLRYTSVMAAVLALTAGAYANAQVTSADIVDGEVKTPDIASGAVTSAKIAGSAVTGAKIASSAVTGAKIAGSAVTGAKIASSAVTGAKVQDNSLAGADIQDGSITGADIQDESITGADISESSLTDVNASELNGFNASELIRIGQTGVTSVVDLPDCNPGLDYLTRTITVPFGGSVLVTSMFTAQNISIPVGGSLPIAARVELTYPIFFAGVWAEDHSAYASPNQRSNLVATDVFPVSAGANTFVLKVCDGSDTDKTVLSVRGKMTFVYTPNPLL